MKYTDLGFRAFYHQLVVVPLKDELKPCVKDFPGMKDADHILTYGYIDHDCGLTLEVLALARCDDKGFSIAETNDAVKSMIRVGAVAEDPVLFISDDSGEISKLYAHKIGPLHHYDVSEEIVATRGMRFLDSCRDQYYVDDVLVYLLRDGFDPEGCWVRINGIGERWITGILLNEPYQDFGCHKGEQISFVVRKTENGKVVCCSNGSTDEKQ